MSMNLTVLSAVCSSRWVITNGRSSCEKVMAIEEKVRADNEMSVGAVRDTWKAEGTLTLVSESQKRTLGSTNNKMCVQTNR